MAPALSIRIAPAPTSSSPPSSHEKDSISSAVEPELVRRKVYKRRNQQPQQSVPKNPQATLLGLPVELRLRIYEYGFHSTLIHVHHHDDRFTWTACLGSKPDCPLLCANPKWSGLCKEEDRCAADWKSPTDPKGFFALMWSCKFIREEAQGSLYRHTVMSIHPADVEAWLDHIEWWQIQNLTRITFAGPDQHLPVLKKLSELAPNITGVAFQGPTNLWRMGGGQRADPESLWRNLAAEYDLRGLSPRVTIAIEAYAWRVRRSGGPKEEQYRYTMVREGKRGDNYPAQGSGWDTHPITGIAWEDTDVKAEAFKSYPVEWAKTSPWKKCWKQSIPSWWDWV